VALLSCRGGLGRESLPGSRRSRFLLGPAGFLAGLLAVLARLGRIGGQPPVDERINAPLSDESSAKDFHRLKLAVTDQLVQRGSPDWDLMERSAYVHQFGPGFGVMIHAGPFVLARRSSGVFCHPTANISVTVGGRLGGVSQHRNASALLTFKVFSLVRRTDVAKRQQLPPQIKKLEIIDRRTGKPVTRYQLTVDAGADPQTGKRRQVRRRYTSEKTARDALAEIGTQASTGTFVPRKAVTVEELCADWLASLHNARATTVNGYAYVLAPLRERHGHLAAQKLTRPDLDKLLVELRDGGTKTAKGNTRAAWSHDRSTPRSTRGGSCSPTDASAANSPTTPPQR
jgi:hypothetical protein